MRKSVIFWLAAALLWVGCDDSATKKPDPEPQDTAEVSKDTGQEDLSQPDTVDQTETTEDPCVDQDQDGAFAGEGCAKATDCDDSNAQVNPSATEICGDGIDNNCADGVDENCPCATGEIQLCSSYGDPLTFGPETLCKPGFQRCDAGEWMACEGELVSPAEETCNGLDDNCDGQVDEGLLNGLGECDDGTPLPPEDCGPTGEGNGLDDDGDGEIDDGCLSCLTEGGEPRTNQPCYSGTLATLGQGVCKAGLRDCGSDGAWGLCEGEVIPVEEVCGDLLDNDCDGLIDEVCYECTPTGNEVCDGLDNNCDGRVDEGVLNACGYCGAPAAMETCDDGLDNDCNGEIDDGCACTDGQTQGCYPGALSTQGVGACSAGTQACSGGQWGPCEGAVLPGIEICDDASQDEDCDTLINENCGCTEGASRPCGDAAGACEYGTETCTAGVWGTCTGGVEATPEVCDGVDNDCNGLTDEGLLNACGVCEGSCYEVVVEPGGSELDAGLEEIPADHEDNPQDRPGVSLSSKAAIPPYLWAANHTNQTVSKVDTRTGLEVGRYWVGNNPSRTAVDLTGNMWVGGRDDGRLTQVLWDHLECEDRNGNGTIDTSYRDASGVVHVINSAADPYADECVAYSEQPRPDLPSLRGVAADPEGRVWFGYSASPGGIQYIDPYTHVLGPYFAPTGLPYYQQNTEGVLELVPDTYVDAGMTYGMVIDSNGLLYLSSYNRGILPCFDTNTETWKAAYQRLANCSYGIAVDAQDRIWAGGYYECSGVNMFDPNEMKFYGFGVPSTAGPSHKETILVDFKPGCSAVGPDHFYTTGVGVEPNTGDVWTSFYPIGYTGRLRLNEDDLSQSVWTFIATTRDYTQPGEPFLPGVSQDLRGVGFDGEGYAWTLGLGSGNVWKIDPATNDRAADLPMGSAIGISSHYTYSDFTGSTTLSFTAPRGTWRYVFETSYSSVQIDSITWDAHVPAGTAVGVRIRQIDASDVPISDWTPFNPDGTPVFFEYPPGASTHTVNLADHGGPLMGQRFELELLATTTDRDIRPIIYDLRFEWSRP